MNMKSTRKSAAVGDTAAAILPLVDALAAALESGDSHIEGEPRLATLAMIRAGIERIAENAGCSEPCPDVAVELIDGASAAREMIGYVCGIARAADVMLRELQTDAQAGKPITGSAGRLAEIIGSVAYLAGDAHNTLDCTIEGARSGVAA